MYKLLGKEELSDAYTRDPADDSGVVLNATDEATLVGRLSARRQAQRSRDYAGADAIRDEPQHPTKPRYPTRIQYHRR